MIKIHKLCIYLSTVCVILMSFFISTAQSEVAEKIITDTPVEYVETKDTFLRAKVVAIIEEGEKETEEGVKQAYQKVELEILTESERGKKIVINHGSLFAIEEYQRVEKGDVVIIAKPAASPKENFYYIVDHYRVNRVAIGIGLFFVLAIIFGRRKGFMAIVGMIISALVIFYFIAPRILQGDNPLVASLVGAFCILLVSLYVSHGFNKRTTIALVSSAITLALATGIDIAFVRFAHLSGAGTEEAFYLQFGNSSINLRGLLLGGIIIGVLGVLDDVTTAQSATVEEISKANSALTFKELYRSGLSVGKEHIASLVNTLLLAYVGASFPLILLFGSNKNQPLWMIFNSNLIAEEIVRTIVGSAAIILAVPITTLLAAYLYSNRKKSKTLVSTSTNSSISID